MKSSAHRLWPGGFTLLELICVMAIITVLAGLILGPASRLLGQVRAEKWAEDASKQMDATVEQLQKHFRGKEDFPPVTLRRIEEEGLVGPIQLDFLRDPRVTFIPFAGADPDEQLVISVQLEKGFLTGRGTLSETKGAITKVPE